MLALAIFLMKRVETLPSSVSHKKTLEATDAFISLFTASLKCLATFFISFFCVLHFCVALRCRPVCLFHCCTERERERRSFGESDAVGFCLCVTREYSRSHAVLASRKEAAYFIPTSLCGWKNLHVQDFTFLTLQWEKRVREEYFTENIPMLFNYFLNVLTKRWAGGGTNTHTYHPSYGLHQGPNRTNR